MRSVRTVLVVALALGVGAALAQEPPDRPATPGVSGKDTPPPSAARKTILPPGLAKKLGPEVPEEAWIAFHPTRDDGAWFLIDHEWTLMTGFPTALRAEVKKARQLPAKVPPVPLPNMGVPLHVVLFEPP